MKMFYFILILVLLFNGNASESYSQSGIVLDVELPDEVGYLEPLNLKYSFLYKGEEAININSPYYSWDVYIRREDHDAECLIYSGGNLLIGGQTISYVNCEPGLSFTHIFEADLVLCDFKKSGLDVCPPNEGFTLKPGKYVLKLVYYPLQEKEQAIVKEEGLIVVDYKESKEKEAAAWLESLFHPLFLYEHGLPGCRYCDDQAIALAEEFIRRFPESRFAADAHLKIAAKTETFHWRYDIEYSKEDYDEIIYHYEQAEAKKTGIMKEVMRERVSEKLRKLKFLRKRHY
ncbi:MAG: hypothetical protein KI786_02320 [Mameliella sp.]|nr:hypothetical protein [Phaeodactylibacter sp.]